MSAEIKPLFEPAREEQIAALEEKLKNRLPDDYRDFLLKYNGGSVKPNVFSINPEQGESSLSLLFGITSRKAYDLWTNALEAYEDFDRSFLPIGEDPGGNQLFMNLRSGQILFRDHEMEAASSLFPIAASFTVFLDSLHEMRA